MSKKLAGKVALITGGSSGLGLATARMTEEQIKQFDAEASATTPLGRTGTPDEFAQAVLLLASDDSSFVTGIKLFVDGGAAQI